MIAREQMLSGFCLNLTTPHQRELVVLSGRVMTILTVISLQYQRPGSQVPV